MLDAIELVLIKAHNNTKVPNIICVAAHASFTSSSEVAFAHGGLWDLSHSHRQGDLNMLLWLLILKTSYLQL